MEKLLDSIIIGSGPAGLSAAIYGKRAELSIIVVEKDYEGTGQIVESAQVDNYLGIPGIDGYELGEKFREHAVSLGVEFVNLEVTGIEKIDNNLWEISFEDESKVKAKSIIFATGSKPRKLNIPGEAEYLGKGISFCAICDGSFYKEKTVAVIGGGDTALDDALYLSKIAKKVYLIHRRDEFRGSVRTQEKVKNTENIELVLKESPVEIKGDKKVSSIVLASGKEVEVDGIFVAIGSAPQTALVKEFIKTDEQGYIIAKEDGGTSEEGFYVAGDVRTKKLRQVITAVSDGACAITSAIDYIKGL